MRTAALLAGICAVTLLGLGGCASLRGVVHRKEDLLAAAGFTMRPANTPARQAELDKLPAHRFVVHAVGNHVEYLYADPLVCDCLYTGDQKNWNNYRHEVFELHIEGQRQLTAQMYNEPPSWWYGWSWGPWGWGGPPWW